MTVVDTSVALKWFVTEADSERADQLIGAGLIAPDLILAELGNALWKKVGRAELSSDQAQAALAGLGAVVSLVPAAYFAPRALELSFELNHPIYDCFFIAAAEEHRLQLVTADRRLIECCADSAYTPIVVDLASEAWK